MIIEEEGEGEVLDCDKSTASRPVVKQENTDVPISDTKMAMQVRKLEAMKQLWVQDKVRKEHSPKVKAFVNDIQINPVIDEGSELNCLNEDFAISYKIEFSSTLCSASSAGMQVMGQTVEDFVISPVHTNTVLWDLGKCVIVKNLSVDLLIGEPGKLDIRENQPGWVVPRVLTVSDGTIEIEIETCFPVKINKNEAFADIVGMISADEEIEELGQIKKVLKDTRDYSHLNMDSEVFKCDTEEMLKPLDVFSVRIDN